MKASFVNINEFSLDEAAYIPKECKTVRDLRNDANNHREYY